MDFVVLRSRLWVVALLAAVFASTGIAQQVGARPETVEQTLGKPALVLSSSGGRTTWSYADGRKVIFRDNKVVEVTAPVARTVARKSEGPDDDLPAGPVPVTAATMAAHPVDEVLQRRAAELVPHRVGVIEWFLRVAAIGTIAFTWTLRRAAAGRG
jgi:hypothetical protein